MTGIGIVEARRRAGVGQRELALALGTSPQRLSDIERGYTPVPDGFTARVRGALVGILRGRLDALVGGGG